MKAVIFAAGEGKRMLPLTLEKPKPLLEVLGKPLLSYTFDALPGEVDEVVVIVGYKEDMIRAYLGENFRGKKVTYVRQEKATGTGAALMLVREHVAGEKFFTVYADDIYAKEDFEKLLPHQHGMLLAHAADPSRFGVVELNEKGEVVEIVEKPEHPKSDLVSTGIYMLTDKIFDYPTNAHKNGEHYLTDMVELLAKDTPVVGVESTRWIQIGYPQDLARAAQYLSLSR